MDRPARDYDLHARSAVSWTKPPRRQPDAYGRNLSLRALGDGGHAPTLKKGDRESFWPAPYRNPEKPVSRLWIIICFLGLMACDKHRRRLLVNDPGSSRSTAASESSGITCPRRRQLARFYAGYVDGARTELAVVACATVTAATFRVHVAVVRRGPRARTRWTGLVRHDGACARARALTALPLHHRLSERQHSSVPSYRAPLSRFRAAASCSLPRCRPCERIALSSRRPICCFARNGRVFRRRAPPAGSSIILGGRLLDYPAITLTDTSARGMAAAGDCARSAVRTDALRVRDLPAVGSLGRFSVFTVAPFREVSVRLVDV